MTSKIESRRVRAITCLKEMRIERFYCVLKTKRDVCGFMVLCVVHARKINVTCLVKVLSKNGSRGQKYTSTPFRRSVLRMCSIYSIAFVSLSFSPLSSSSRPRIERVVCIRRWFFLAPPFFSRGVVLYSLFGALEVPSVRHQRCLLPPSRF